MNRVLVTGGTGFIGAHLVRRLLVEGHDVHLLLRPSSDHSRLRAVEAQLAVHLADLADGQALERLLAAVKPHWVFHLAAHGAYSFQTDVSEMVRTNYAGTTALVQAAVRAGVEIMVHAGSSSEYGFKDHAPDEDEPVEPNSAYAATKAAATQFCRFAARTHRLPIPTVRLYSIYGPLEDPRRLLPTLVTHALAKKWPPLAAPETARDFVYVDDAIDALLAIARRPPADPGAIYNLGSGRQTTLRELAAVAADVFSVPAAPAWGTLTPRAWDTDVWVANPARLKADYGWAPKTDLRQGLRALAASLR